MAIYFFAPDDPDGRSLARRLSALQRQLDTTWRMRPGGAAPVSARTEPPILTVEPTTFARAVREASRR